MVIIITLVTVVPISVLLAFCCAFLRVAVHPRASKQRQEWQVAERSSGWWFANCSGSNGDHFYHQKCILI